MERKNSKQAKRSLQYDKKGKKIKPDYWSEGMPYYYNHDIVEYEVHVNGQYYATVHVSSKRKGKEMKNTHDADRRYWQRIRKEVETQAHKVYPGLLRHNDTAKTYHFIKVIE